jgi:hypothetical protein
MFTEVITSLIALVLTVAAWALIYGICGPWGAALLLAYYIGKES